MSNNHPNSMHSLEFSRAGEPLANVSDLFVDYFIEFIDHHSIFVQDKKGGHSVLFGVELEEIRSTFN